MSKNGVLGVSVQDYLASLGSEERDLFSRVDLGMDIESFLTGHPVGRFLGNVCEVERESATEALIRSMTEEPENAALHRKHHRRIEMCNQFKNWLLDAIEVGKDAERQLHARESTD